MAENWGQPRLRDWNYNTMVVVTAILTVMLSILGGAHAGEHPVPAYTLELPLGSVVDITPQSCSSPPGADTGAICYSGTVICPLTDDDTFYLAINQVANPNGFVVMIGGKPEANFWGGPDSEGPFAPQANTDGYSTAQVAFSDAFDPLVASSSNTYPENAMRAACRFATIASYLYDTYDPGGTVPFGMWGLSEATSQILYALIDYGLGSITQAAQLAAATPAGDLYAGCTNPPGFEVVVGTHTTATSVINPCSSSSTSMAVIGSQYANIWAGTTTCQSPPFLPSDITSWKISSLDNRDVGDFRLPTCISHFDCPRGNEVPGLGTYILNRIQTENITYSACGITGSGNYCPATGLVEEYYNTDGGDTRSSTGPGFFEMVRQFEADLQGSPCS